jgi:hypothetical protein
MNVVNTLDNGLIVRTIQELKKKKEVLFIVITFTCLGTNERGASDHFNKRVCRLITAIQIDLA